MFAPSLSINFFSIRPAYLIFVYIFRQSSKQLHAEHSFPCLLMNGIASGLPNFLRGVYLEHTQNRSSLQATSDRFFFIKKNAIVMYKCVFLSLCGARISSQGSVIQPVLKPSNLTVQAKQSFSSACAMIRRALTRGAYKPEENPFQIAQHVLQRLRRVLPRIEITQDNSVAPYFITINPVNQVILLSNNVIKAACQYKIFSYFLLIFKLVAK